MVPEPRKVGSTRFSSGMDTRTYHVTLVAVEKFLNSQSQIFLTFVICVR
jgi:hypothetical protein